jgi:hypothetical protein
MLGAALSNAALASRSPVYLATFGVQLAFYAAAAAGAWSGAGALRIPSYLLLSNAAILSAWLRFAWGERITSWNPSDRPAALPQTSAR